MKKILIILFCLICIFALVACKSDKDNNENKEKESQGLEFVSINGGESYEVSGIGTCKDENIVIPSKYKGKPVVSIGEYAFNDSDIRRVKIPDSVETIKRGAFYKCGALVSVSIGNGVSSIGDYAFCDGIRLTSISLGRNVSSIGENAFTLCDIICIRNESSLQLRFGSGNHGEIAKHASVIIQNGSTSYINDGYDYTLTSDDFLFRCRENQYELIAYLGENDAVTLPSSINGSTYEINSLGGLVDVILSNGVTRIQSFAFTSCNRLESITVSSSVSSIGSCAFNSCYNLERVTFESTNGWFIFEDTESESGTSVDVSDPETNAELLTGEYEYWYWKRSE